MWLDETLDGLKSILPERAREEGRVSACCSLAYAPAGKFRIRSSMVARNSVGNLRFLYDTVFEVGGKGGIGCVGNYTGDIPYLF